MTYKDLLNDLSVEVGGRSDVVSRLPQFIREVETQLWPRLEGFATEGSVTVPLSANATEAAMSDTLFLRILSVYDEDGNPLDRVSYRKTIEINAASDGDALDFYAWRPGEGSIYVALAPSEDTTITVVTLSKDAPLETGDDETSKFFLGAGYNLIKYGVLSMRVFDKERWPAWRQQFDRELHALYAASQKRNLSYAGSDGRRWL